ncbi:hypothetical protein DBR36_04225 [Microbacterium sp. HMWF026]|nr:hypothetical protein DBR36_04225 [Microbacterium sp. HMWF026]
MISAEAAPIPSGSTASVSTPVAASAPPFVVVDAGTAAAVADAVGRGVAVGVTVAVGVGVPVGPVLADGLGVGVGVGEVDPLGDGVGDGVGDGSHPMTLTRGSGAVRMPDVQSGAVPSFSKPNVAAAVSATSSQSYPFSVFVQVQVSPGWNRRGP